MTLPRGWLNYFGIKAGDQVEIVADGDLVIRPIRSPEVEEKGQVQDAGEATRTPASCRRLHLA